MSTVRQHCISARRFRRQLRPARQTCSLVKKSMRRLQFDLPASASSESASADRRLLCLAFLPLISKMLHDARTAAIAGRAAIYIIIDRGLRWAGHVAHCDPDVRLCELRSPLNFLRGCGQDERPLLSNAEETMLRRRKSALGPVRRSHDTCRTHNGRSVPADAAWPHSRKPPFHRCRSATKRRLTSGWVSRNDRKRLPPVLRQSLQQEKHFGAKVATCPIRIDRSRADIRALPHSTKYQDDV